MSYSSIQAAVRDLDLQDRVTAGAMKEAIRGGSEYVDSVFGGQLRDYPALALNTFLWPVATEYETEYEYALGAGNERPGYDVGVISDANIGSAIQAHWPADPALIPQDTRPDPTREPRPDVE